MLTSAMIRRIERVGTVWCDEGYGYYSAEGDGLFSTLAYIALPKTHPLCGVDYEDVDDSGGPRVNGGLTFSDDNVFGWDYGHFENNTIIEVDINNALNYFRSCERVGPVVRIARALVDQLKKFWYFITGGFLCGS